VRFLVGETYLRMGRIERAVQELEYAEDDPDALYNLGLARFYQGDFPGSVNAFRRALFANLHLPSMLAETPIDHGDERDEDKPKGTKGDKSDSKTEARADEAPRPKAESSSSSSSKKRRARDDDERDDDEDDQGKPRLEVPTDPGTHPKGLDSEGAAHDYVDRCGDFWFGRPVLQRWLKDIAEHPTVADDVRRHLRHLRALNADDVKAGDRARIEGENTALRSAARLATADRKIAGEVLARVFVLPPEKPEAPAKPE
jgi:hypothetical protein